MRILLVTDRSETQMQLEACLRETAQSLLPEAPNERHDTSRSFGSSEPAPSAPGPSNDAVVIDWVRRSREGIFCVRDAMEANQRYGMVLVDQLAPSDLDRVETIQQLWEADPEIGVLLTAPGCPETRRRIAKRLECRGRLLFLAKPLDLLEVEQAAGMLLQRQLAVDGWRRSILELNATRNTLERMKAEACTGSVATTEFMANLSHDIRSPMNAILGFSRLLMRDPITSDQRKKLGYVQDAGARLLRLIDEILDFAEVVTGKGRVHEAPFAVSDTIERAKHDAADQAERKGLELLVHHDPALSAPMIGDDTRIRKVLGYLIDNAIRYTEFGSITVGSNQEKTTERHVVVRFSVRDTGAGIDPERLDGLFEAETVFAGVPSRRAEGLGLGLPICRRLVEMMGGQIGAETQPGGGSTFWFTVPLQLEPDTLASDNEPATVDASRRPAENVPTKAPAKQRILVAEDDPLNQTLAVALLSKAGYCVDVAEDGNAAINAVTKNEYDLVFMDVQMPHCDGLKATRKIRADEAQTQKHLRIVALTANASPGDRQRCLAAGADDYLAKPFAPETLFACVQRHLNEEPHTDHSASPVVDSPPLREVDASCDASDSADTASSAEAVAQAADAPAPEPPDSSHREFAPLVAEIRKAANAKRWEELDLAAGRLRGTAQQQQETGLADNALRIQVAARSGDADRVANVLARLLPEKLKASED